jgi:hypothetical protein
MGPAIAKFLQAAASLAKKGVKEADILEFAKREFGEVSDLLKIQVRRIFKNKDAPSIKNPSKQEGEVIPFKKDQASGIMQTEEASSLMERLEKGIETLKTMKQPGMDLTVGLTRTAVRKILDRSGIKVPDKVDPIEVFEKNFGGDALMDVKDVAEEMIELERMGKSTKSMDEILEQSGMFDIKINPDAPKGMSDEQIEQIKKEVDQEKLLKDFDPTDREPNAEGGINTLMASDDMNERLLEKLYEDFLDQGLSPEEAKKAAEEAFRERAAYGGMMRNNFAMGSLPKGIQSLVKMINKKFGKGTMKTADEIDKPEKNTQQLISEFEAREKANNKMDAIVKDQIEGGFIRDMEKSMQRDMQRELKKPAREILDVPPVPEGFKLSKEKLMAKFPEIDESFADEMVNMDKDTAGRLIKMLENRRLDPEAYDRLLAEYGDTLEFQAEFDKVVRRKNNNQGGLNYLMGM